MDAVSSGAIEMGHGGPYYWKGKVAATQYLSAIPFGLTPQEQNSWFEKGGGQEIADEKQIELDEIAFNKHLEQQRNRGRTSWIQSTEETALSTKRDFPFNKTNFLGYENLEFKTAQVIGIHSASKNVSILTEGQEGEIFLDKSPFYTQKGGQNGDTGILKGTNFEAVVTDTYDVGPSYSAHLTNCIRGSMKLNDEVHATVDLIRHNSINRNHTATHLLHSALRQILGFHVKQSGSLVAEDRLRLSLIHI